jgi:hypothetical protein
VESDTTALVLDDTFDAVVGSYVLHQLRDPVLVLRQLVRHLRPDGIVAIQEADLTRLGTSVPALPLFEQVGVWIKEPLRREGLDLQFGLRLYRVFLDPDLPPPQLHCQSFLGTGPDWPWYDVLAGRVGSVLPLLLKYGLFTEEEVEISTLAQRLREAAGADASVVMAPDLVSAWTRTLHAEGCSAEGSISGFRAVAHCSVKPHPVPLDHRERTGCSLSAGARDGESTLYHPLEERGASSSMFKSRSGSSHHRNKASEPSGCFTHQRAVTPMIMESDRF